MTGPRLLLRMCRRLSSWEAGNVDEIVDYDFRAKDSQKINLAPSFYEIDSGDGTQAVRICAEHCGSFLRPGPAAQVDGAGIGIGIASATAGKTAFAFANAAHREIVFSSEDQLRAFLRALVAEISVRYKDFSTDEMLSYIEGKVVAGDAEWMTALKEGGRGARWAERVGRHRKERQG